MIGHQTVQPHSLGEIYGYPFAMSVAPPSKLWAKAHGSAICIKRNPQEPHSSLVISSAANALQATACLRQRVTPAGSQAKQPLLFCSVLRTNSTCSHRPAALRRAIHSCAARVMRQRPPCRTLRRRPRPSTPWGGWRASAACALLFSRSIADGFLGWYQCVHFLDAP